MRKAHDRPESHGNRIGIYICIYIRSGIVARWMIYQPVVYGISPGRRKRGKPVTVRKKRFERLHRGDGYYYLVKKYVFYV